MTEVFLDKSFTNKEKSNRKTDFPGYEFHSIFLLYTLTKELLN